jgi:putative heme-binding domain-containing protein
MRFALLSSLESGAGNVLATLLGSAPSRETPGLRELTQALAAQIGRQQRSEDLSAILRILRDNQDRQLAQDLITALAPKPGSSLAEQLAAATGGQAEELLTTMLADARRNSSDIELSVAERIDAVYRLQLSRFAAERQHLALLLTPEQAPELQEAVVRTLATFDDPAVAELVLEAWPALGPRARLRAADLVFSRPAWINVLLDAIEQGRVSGHDIPASHWQLLAAHSDAELRERGLRLQPSVSSDRRELLQRYEAALTMSGSAERGRAIFQRTCAACHQLQGQGHAIGPNLAAMRNRGDEAILTNVLTPNAEVNPQYVSYVVTTKDGRTLSGLVVEETAAGITLLRAENVRDAILRIDIDEMRSTGLSLMPEGLEKEIDLPAMADLLEYLRTLE